MAVATLLVNLYGNNKWLMVNPKTIYELAVEVSRSSPKEKDKCFLEIGSFLRKNIIDRSLIERLFDKWSR